MYDPTVSNQTIELVSITTTTTKKKKKKTKEKKKKPVIPKTNGIFPVPQLLQNHCKIYWFVSEEEWFIQWKFLTIICIRKATFWNFLSAFPKKQILYYRRCQMKMETTLEYTYLSAPEVNPFPIKINCFLPIYSWRHKD